MRNTFIEELVKLAKVNEKIVLITGDLGFGVVEKFSGVFPERFFNFGVAEQSIMSAAAGLASEGFQPYVYSIANFPTLRCLEQIRNDVCYMNLNVSIVGIGAGFAYGTAGYSHHAIEDLAALSAYENLQIYTPSDPEEVKESLRDSLYNSNPKYFRLGKGGEPNLEIEKVSKLENGLNEFDACLLFSGSIGSECLLAKSILSDLGIQIKLISIWNLKLDNILDHLKFFESKPLITVEEHVQSGGLGSRVLSLLNENGMTKPILTLGVKSIQNSSPGNVKYLREQNGLSGVQIAEKIQDYLRKYDH